MVASPPYHMARSRSLQVNTSFEHKNTTTTTTTHGSRASLSPSSPPVPPSNRSGARARASTQPSPSPGVWRFYGVQQILDRLRRHLLHERALHSPRRSRGGSEVGQVVANLRRRVQRHVTQLKKKKNGDGGGASFHARSCSRQQQAHTPQ